MAKKYRLNFNVSAPDLTLLTPAREPVALSSLWKDKPLLLAFTRHFGCTQCKIMLADLVENRDRILAAGLSIAVVMQGSPEMTAVFAEHFAPGLFCLSDQAREAYRAYGLERGDLFQTFLNPRVWKAVAGARKRGFKVETPPEGQDAMQMSGTFIITRKGQIALPYYYDDIADHPPVDLLLNGVLSTRWDRDFEGPLGINGEKNS
jgi:peroxiredoxin